MSVTPAPEADKSVVLNRLKELRNKKTQLCSTWRFLEGLIRKKAVKQKYVEDINEKHHTS